MLKRITAALLLLAFMASSFCRAVIVMDYYTNSTAYAKNCENKSRPKLHCNGKCQMMKKLQQEEKKDEGNPEKKAGHKTGVISSKSFFATAFLFKQTAGRCYALTIDEKPVDRCYRLLHPPPSGKASLYSV
jgi:hypothetical protein